MQSTYDIRVHTLIADLDQRDWNTVSDQAYLATGLLADDIVNSIIYSLLHVR